MNRTGEQLERLMLEIEQFASETGDEPAREVAQALRELVGAMSTVADMGDAFTPGFGRQMYRFVAAQGKLGEIMTRRKWERERRARGPSSTETDG